MTEQKDEALLMNAALQGMLLNLQEQFPNNVGGALVMLSTAAAILISSSKAPLVAMAVLQKNLADTMVEVNAPDAKA